MDEQNEAVVFGGGCFWCTEAVFAELKGVTSVLPGYAGGHTENPTYREVCSEQTGHAEVSKVQFDPAQISFRDLLSVFFATHNPTTLNRQGADSGTQYRSVILYGNNDQKEQSKAFIEDLGKSGAFSDPVVTEVVPLEIFYEAEPEHKQFYLANPDSMYCQIVIRPKMAKFREKFSLQLR